MKQNTPGVLDGIRILDLSSVLMGPLATQHMGDLGAEVIAIEDHRGDTNRFMGAGPAPKMSGTSLNLMRNKRSVAIDLKAPGGRDAFLAIAATCDVVVTNLRPGPLGRLRLTYDDVRAINPSIIFCQAQGFASDTDKANAPAYDDIIQSAAGIPELFQRGGQEPILAPTVLADKVCGMAIASAVLAALFHRERTGQGQHIEVPMRDVMSSFMLTEHGAGAVPEPPSSKSGHLRILNANRRPQRTADGLLHVMPYSGTHYREIFVAGGHPEFAEESDKIKTQEERFAAADTLYSYLAICMRAKTTAEWESLCEANDIPCTRVISVDEQLQALEIVDHPHVGTYRHIPHPVRYSATPATRRRPSPLHGEHGRDVLLEVGVGADQIDDLISAGVLLVPTES